MVDFPLSTRHFGQTTVMRILMLPLLLLAALLSGASNVSAQFLVGPPKAVPSLISDTKAVAASQPFTLGIRFTLAEHWHLYWRFPGDSGAAPEVEWSLPPGFEAGPIQWPLPRLLKSEGDLFTNVYENEVLFPVEIRPPAQIPAAPFVITAKLKWYVCSETCLPGDGEVSLSLSPGEPAPDNADLFALWKSRLPQSSPAPFQLKWTKNKDSVTVAVTGLEDSGKVEFYPIPPRGVMAEHPEPLASDPKGRTFRIPSPEAGLASEDWKALVVLEEGGARRGWEVSATFSQSAGGSPGGVVAGRSDSPRGSAASMEAPRDANAGGLGKVLWAAFLGGLLLNLMPCVLPVIALKIFGFTQQAGEQPGRVFRLGLAFCAGVFTFFLGLAMAVAGLKAAGGGLNWGFQFQNPWILSGLIASVFVFGLNLLGVFEISLGGGANAKLSALSSKQGYGGAFLHGAFTTLLGTSCTAPYLGVTLGFAVSQTTPVVIAIFLTIAAGMSLPYLLLTSNPALLRFLPKPGAWMERLKQLMGFVILAVAVWMLGVLGKSLGVDAIAGTGAFLLVLGFACWIFGTLQNRVLALLAALLVSAAGYRFFVYDALMRGPVHSQGGAESSEEGWEPFSPERVAKERAAGRPVFVDFTAEWCLNCKVNERVTLSKQEVQAAFKKRGVVMLKADWTHKDAVITEELNRFNRIGVPFYLLYKPGADAPHVFPELLTPGLVLEALGSLPER